MVETQQLVKIIIQGSQPKAKKVLPSQSLSTLRNQNLAFIRPNLAFMWEDSEIELADEENWSIIEILKDGKEIHLQERKVQTPPMLEIKIGSQNLKIEASLEDSLSKLRVELSKEVLQPFFFLMEGDAEVDANDEESFTAQDILSHGIIEIMLESNKQTITQNDDSTKKSHPVNNQCLQKQTGSLIEESKTETQYVPKNTQLPDNQTLEIKEQLIQSILQHKALMTRGKALLINASMEEVNTLMEELVILNRSESIKLYEQFAPDIPNLVNPNGILIAHEVLENFIHKIQIKSKYDYKNYKELRSNNRKLEEVIQEIFLHDSQEILKILKPQIFEILNKGEDWDKISDQLYSGLENNLQSKEFKWLFDLMSNQKLKFLFFLVYFNSDTCMKERIIASMSKYYAVPLMYTTYINNAYKLNFIEEHFFQIHNSHLMISIGLGKINNTPSGKSSFISELFSCHLNVHENIKPNLFYRSTIDIYSTKDAFPASYDIEKYRFDKIVRYSLIDVNGGVQNSLIVDTINALTSKKKAIFIIQIDSENIEQELNDQFGKELLEIISRKSVYSFIFVKNCIQPQQTAIVSSIDQALHKVIYHIKGTTASQYRKEVLTILTEKFNQQFQDILCDFSPQNRLNYFSIDQETVALAICEINQNRKFTELRDHKNKFLALLDHDKFNGFKFLDFYPVYIKKRKLEQIYSQLQANDQKKSVKNKLQIINLQIVQFEEELQDLGKMYKQGNKENQIISQYLRIMEMDFPLTLLLADLQKSLTNFSKEIKQINKDKTKLNSQFKAEVQENDKFSIEIIMRELWIQQKYCKDEKLNDQCLRYQKILFELGEPIEIIDGDNLVSQMGDLSNKLLQTQNQTNPLYITIFGQQSSGKSTCLNHVFGCQFFTSDGRATRGLYMSSLNFDEQTKEKMAPYDQLIVIDTEGFQSIERQYLSSVEHYNQIMENYQIKDQTGQTVKIEENEILQSFKFDNIISLFSLSMSDIVLINTKGEQIGDSMKNLLFLCVRGLVELKQNTTKPDIFFIMNQCSQTSLESIEGALKQSAEQIMNKEELKKVVFDDQKFEVEQYISIKQQNISILPSAFRTRKRIDESYFSMPMSFTEIDESYSGECQQLRKKLFDIAKQRVANRTSQMEKLIKWAANSHSIFESIFSFQKLWTYADKTDLIIDKNLKEVQKTLMKYQSIYQQKLEQIVKKYLNLGNSNNIEDITSQYMSTKTELDKEFRDFNSKQCARFNEIIQKSDILKVYIEKPAVMYAQEQIKIDILQYYTSYGEQLSDHQNRKLALINTQQLKQRVKKEFTELFKNQDIKSIEKFKLRDQFENLHGQISSELLKNLKKPDAEEYFQHLKQILTNQISNLDMLDLDNLRKSIKKNQNQLQQKEIFDRIDVKYNEIQSPIEGVYQERIQEVYQKLTTESVFVCKIQDSYIPFDFDKNILKAFPSGNDEAKDFTYLDMKKRFQFDKGGFLRSSSYKVIKTDFEEQNPYTLLLLQDMIKNKMNDHAKYDKKQEVAKLLNHYGNWKKLIDQLEGVNQQLASQGALTQERVFFHIQKINQFILYIQNELSQLQSSLNMEINHQIISVGLLQLTQRKYECEVQKYCENMRKIYQEKEDIWKQCDDWVQNMAANSNDIDGIDDIQQSEQLANAIFTDICGSLDETLLSNFRNDYCSKTIIMNHDFCNEQIRQMLDKHGDSDGQRKLINFFQNSRRQKNLLEDIIIEEIKNKTGDLSNLRAQQFEADVIRVLQIIITDLNQLKNHLNDDENQYHCSFLFNNQKNHFNLQSAGLYYMLDIGKEYQNFINYEIDEVATQIPKERGQMKKYEQQTIEFLEREIQFLCRTKMKNLKVFINNLIKELDQCKKIARDFIINKLESIRRQEQQIVIDRAYGCRVHCPSCKRKCTKRALHEEQHQCEEGHYVLGFIGGEINGEPDELCMVSCDTRQDYSLRPWLQNIESYVDWSDYVAAHKDWNFKSNYNIEETNRKIWESIGKQLCQIYNKDFNCCSFTKYRKN